MLGYVDDVESNIGGAAMFAVRAKVLRRLTPDGFRSLLIPVMMISVMLPGPAAADLWGNIVDGVKNLAQSTVNVVVAPTQAAGSVIQGRPIDEVARNYVANYGQQLQAAGGLAQTIDNSAYQIQAGLASQISPQARWIFDNTTVTSRYGTQLITTSVQVSGALLQGQDPRMIGTAMLAAAMKEAYQHYIGASQPLPSEFANLLRVAYSDQQIANARYVVDPGFTITLPSVIQNFQREIGGGDYGVAIGNLIIFRQVPSYDWTGFGWVAHEVQHTVQYSALGIDNFALQYALDYSAIENDANNHAQLAVANLQQVLLQQQQQQMQYQR